MGGAPSRPIEYRPRRRIITRKNKNRNNNNRNNNDNISTAEDNIVQIKMIRKLVCGKKEDYEELDLEDSTTLLRQVRKLAKVKS